MSATPVTQALATLLADSYTLYLKTQNFHWNVKGPQFFQLHNTFEAHYTELAAAIDEIAERIKALGEHAPGSYSEYLELANVKECTNRPNAMEMVKALVADLDTMTKTAQRLIDVATEAGDDVSADIGVQRAALHSKQRWMLDSLQES